MGYQTDVSGRLDFTHDITVRQLAELKTILGEDCRENPDWKAGRLTYINFRLTKDYLGIEWDESEKSCDMTECVNLIIALMRRKYPDFGLSGSMTAQGEKVDDRWILLMDLDGVAKTKRMPTHKEIHESYAKLQKKYDELVEAINKMTSDDDTSDLVKLIEKHKID